MVVHFNVSQSEEMVERGWIKRGGAIYRHAKRCEERALADIDGLVCVSEFMHSHLVSAVPAVANTPYRVIPNFVAPVAGATDGPAGDIITIGTLEPRKNQIFLLHVLAAARARGKRYSLTIVGRGCDETKLKADVVRLGLSGQVTFAGYVEGASSLIPRHKLYAHAARVENCPIALIEALSSGIPVLAPPVGGIPEIITEGIEGFFWDLDNIDGGAERLISVLDDNTLRLRMGVAGRKKYTTCFRPDLLAPRLHGFLTGVDGRSCLHLGHNGLCAADVSR
jgi:glycosyltransferase involved in cell wall biosynthesis